jgi:hypothetical protein
MLETVGDLRWYMYLVLSVWLPAVVLEGTYVHTHIHCTSILPCVQHPLSNAVLLYAVENNAIYVGKYCRTLIIKIHVTISERVFPEAPWKLSASTTQAQRKLLSFHCIHITSLFPKEFFAPLFCPTRRDNHPPAPRPGDEASLYIRTNS